jgi:hypothetical protein
MKDKKHIDKLFQDSFKNFEAEPSPEVWKNIQAQLKQEKEDRKIIPLWWKLGGVAALLALLLTVGNYVFSPTEIDPTIITQENTTSPVVNEDSDNTKLQNTENEELLTENDQSPTSDKSQEDSTNKSLLKKQSSKDQLLKKEVASENALAVEESTDKSIINNKNYIDPIIKNNTEVKPTEKEAIAVSTHKNSPEQKNVNVDSQKNNNLIIKGTGVKEIADTKIAKTEVKDDPSISNPTVEENPEELSNKRSLIDVVNEQNEEKEAEDLAKNTTPDNRWVVSPNVAPVYYSSLGGGSSLDPTFSDNPQNGNVNISYGVNVGYSISEKLSIRSGLSNVNLGYSTGGLELGTGPISSALKSINYDKNNSVIIPVDKGSLGGTPPPDGSGGFANITLKSTNGEAELVQNISYYEVPLELQFAIVNNRFGIDMIGGFSTLFLGNNEVSVNAGDFRTSLGEANNLNSVSFTTNVGLGLNYQISKKLKFNIEPIFKYQLNPYSDSSVDYKPYYIGVYSGLSFKF